MSALQPDRKSVLQELGFAGLQVWQSLSEAAGRGRGTQAMAVMFTDLVGFSSWALKAGDEPALALLREVGTRVETTVVGHEGRIVKRLGDGVMATFLSAQAALEAALDAQDEVGDIEIDGYRPSMRVGVHWGAPRKLGGDYLGVDVNIAARVGDAAKADQVLVSDALLARVDASRPAHRPAPSACGPTAPRATCTSCASAATETATGGPSPQRLALRALQLFVHARRRSYRARGGCYGSSPAG